MRELNETSLKLKIKVALLKWRKIGADYKNGKRIRHMNTHQVVTPDLIRSLVGDKSALLVDDDGFSLDINEAYLDDCGWEVHRAANVDEAAKVLLMHKIDLVIADFHMPDRTGDELFELVNKFQFPPVFVFLTTDPTHERIVGIKNRHQVTVWQKPVGPTEIYAKVLDAMRRPRASSTQ